jgi:hypothetical protein
LTHTIDLDFTASVFAAGLNNPRVMALGPGGMLFVTGMAGGQIYVLPDGDGDGIADEVQVWPMGCARARRCASTPPRALAQVSGRASQYVAKRCGMPVLRSRRGCGASTCSRSVSVAIAAMPAASKIRHHGHQGHQTRKENKTCQQFHRLR